MFVFIKCAWKMILGLSILGLVNAITIDNHLVTLKNDCFERLAIGERLDPRDVLHTVVAGSVTECQTACTQEAERCLSLSFGVSPKGNTTCELSFTVIKETADLKPIGTKKDVDYDLYIKKVDCKLNIQKDPLDSITDRPSQPNHSGQPSKDYLPNDVQKPSYLVAILDSPSENKRPNRPRRPPQNSYYNQGYEVNDPNAELDRPHDYYYIYKTPHEPSSGYTGHNTGRKDYRPNHPSPDVLVFHEDKIPGSRPYEQNGPYQNYYDVPRPLPLTYGPEKDSYDSYPKPMSPYSEDYQQYGNGIPYRDPHEMQHRPVYNDYRRPQLDKYDLDERKPSDGYQRRPYDKNRPYGADLDQNKPYGTEPYTQNKPYGPEPYTQNKPYGPEPYNQNKPYGPEPYNQNKPYGPEPYTQNKPYGPEPYNQNKPYGPDSYDQNKPYGPEPYNQNKVYNRVQYPQKPYGPDKYRPDPNNLDNPNTYDNWQTIQDSPYDRNKPYDNRPYYDKPYATNSDTNRKPYRPEYNTRPITYDEEYRPPSPNYYDQNKPAIDINSRPYERPYGQNDYNYDRNRKPLYDRPSIDINRRPYRPNPDRMDPYYYDNRPTSNPDDPNAYSNTRRPSHDRPYEQNKYRGNNWDRYGNGDPKPEPLKSNGTNSTSERKNDVTTMKPEENDTKAGMNKTTTTSTPGGGTVTSIITMILDKPCYRRALAGKRIARNFIKRSVPCESVEACQRECQDEKRFACEGFNYRLDESGRGQGDCELTDIPLVRMDLTRDCIEDRNYDFYEKDRNSGPDCRPLIGFHRPGGYPPTGPWHSGGGWPRPHDRYPPSGPPSGPPARPPLGPPPGHGHGVRYPPPMRPHLPPDYRPPPPPPPYADRRKDGPPSYYSHYYSNRPNWSYRYGSDYGYHYPPSYSSYNRRPYYPRPTQSHYPVQPYNRPYNPRIHYQYQDSYYHDRQRDRHYWGINKYGGWGSYGGAYGNFGRPDSYYGTHRNHNRYDVEDRRYFHPYRVGQVGGPQDWGQYGGSYGTGGCVTICKPSTSSSYWGFSRPPPRDYHDTRRIYYRPSRPTGTGLVPHTGYGGGTYLPLDDHYGHHQFDPAPPGPGPNYDYGHDHGPGNHIGYDDGYIHPHKEDDCSTRRGMGFRLHKTIVKKYFAVPNIHECEKLCYLEKEFTCVSFSYRNSTETTDFNWTEDSDESFDFDSIDWAPAEERIMNEERYSITLSAPTDNCYLSDRPYKDLDFYTDLEPDRDFDIYTMHKKSQSCLIPLPVEEESECFLRVRSGQRLDHAVVKDSVDCKSIVDCQLECLTSKRFTCRSFSYRFGPPLPGGSIDNCQLSDWPYTELNPVKDLVPERGYEVYERGSYGHGCEHDHFMIPGHHGIGDGTAIPKHSDKICYVGYAKPARLTPEAAKGALSVSSELDCKAECTRAREQTDFPCMSFSFRNTMPKGEPNCELSDIEQRDLLPDLDYRRDPESWLFAWDNYSPQCSALIDHHHGSNDHDIPNHDHGVGHPIRHDPLDTWRMYTVNGWPCKRGTTCQENRVAGFWSCELEGGDVGSWDYCCRPDHRCGYSQGYSYPWCYVGPSRDQWRKCSDRYYPYINHRFPTDKHDRPRFPPSGPSGPPGPPYLPRPGGPGSRPPPSWYSERPYRPPWAPGHDSHSPRPSLDEYEDKFNQQFLDPPKPGGFGPARHWPVSYLHKEMPPNATMDDTSKKMSDKDAKNYKAISSLVDSIKANDLKNTKYQVTNQSNSADDVLFVRIPMPDKKAKIQNDNTNDKILKFDIVDMKPESKKSLDNNKQSNDFDDLFLISVPKNKSNIEVTSTRTPKRELQLYPMVRKGHITRANRTGRRRRIRPEKIEKETLQFFN